MELSSPGIASPMSERDQPPWIDERFRERVRVLLDEVTEASDPERPAKELWALGLATDQLGFAGALWRVWGAITDEWTHPEGDTSEGASVALEAANELREVLGDDLAEQRWSDEWISRLGA
jgi:hypothetical protein